MRDTYTIHCLPWENCAPLLQAFRVRASDARVISHIDALPDPADAQSRQALAIDGHGRVIGAARIGKGGEVEKLAVMPHPYRDRIALALREILADYAHTASGKRA